MLESERQQTEGKEKEKRRRNALLQAFAEELIKEDPFLVILLITATEASPRTRSQNQIHISIPLGSCYC